MLYALIHNELERGVEDLQERKFLYSTIENRDSQAEADREFFPDKQMWKAEADDNGVIDEDSRVEI